MIFKIPHLEDEVSSRDWHVFFALTPKNVGDGEYVWLQKAERRISPYSPMGLTYEYRKLSRDLK